MFRWFVRSCQAKTRADANRPEAVVIVSTYQKPRHLRLVLASLALQQMVEGKIELVVTDDGSTDGTLQLVHRFARSVDFPVRMTTHPHREFQVARCRNEGVAASTAPYIIFLDGDCIVRPDFVAQHLRRRKRGVVWNGDCFRLSEEVSARIDETIVRSGEFTNWVSAEERDRLRRANRNARIQDLLRHPSKPNLMGNNIGVCRADYERINGFDEDYVGWGAEDDDLGFRFRQAGIRIKSIRRWTPTYHVWHPRDASWTANWQDGKNVPRLLQIHRETRCRNGLLKLDAAGSADQAALAHDELQATRVVDFTIPRADSAPAFQQRVAA